MGLGLENWKVPMRVVSPDEKAKFHFLLQKSRDLRKNLTAPEQKLWHYLRYEQMNYKFRRQAIIGQYIIDFYCPKAKLAIEIDGDSHWEGNQQELDIIRLEKLTAMNISLLRFTNIEVMRNFEGVYGVIAEFLSTVTRQGKSDTNGLTPP